MRRFLFRAFVFLLLAILVSYFSLAISNFFVFLYGGLPFLGGGSESFFHLALVFVFLIVKWIFPWVLAFLLFLHLKKNKLKGALPNLIILFFLALPFLFQSFLYLKGLVQYKYYQYKVERNLCINENGVNEKINEDVGERWIYECKNGKRNGSFKIFYLNGSLKLEEEYKNGKKVGISTRYNSDGTVLSRIEYDEEGKGKVIYSQSQNERVISSQIESQMKDCEEKNGLVRDFFEKDPGRVFKELTCIEGRFDGEYKEFFYNGQLRIKKNYKNGIAQGPFVIYNEDGSFYYEGIYVNGFEEGPFRQYDRSGNLKLEGVLEDGVRKTLKSY